MAETDLLLRARVALVAVIRASADVQAVAGRATRLVVPWRSLAADTPKPVIAYAVISAPEVGGLGDSREVAVQLAAFADDTADADADVLCDRLLGAAETALATAAWESLEPPLAAVVRDLTRVYRGTTDPRSPVAGDEGASFGAAARADLDVTLDVTSLP